VLIADVIHDGAVLADPAPVELTGAEHARLLQLRSALAIYRETGDPSVIARCLAAAQQLLGLLLGPPRHGATAGRAHLTELRWLATALPEFDELLTVAADEADRAVAAGYARLWHAVGLREPAPRWSPAEHEAARMVFACACVPGAGPTASSPDWLQTSLRRIAATRSAELICGELCRSEAVWLSALGDRYGSLRHRCAPRTLLRSRGLAELVSADENTRQALIRGLERWVAAGGHPHELAAELEAAVVHTRTPARLA
jgi:hypothetical protein